MELQLTAVDREDLERLVRATTTPAGIARRARCVLLLADGRSYSAVCAALDVTDRFVARWPASWKGACWHWPTRRGPDGRITA